MSTIKTKLVDQNITVTNAPNIYSGDVNTDNVVFEFDESWEGFTKSAVFYRNPKERYLQLLKNDQCVIPHEVMGDEGKVVIGVFGVNGDKVITSEVLYYDIGKGAVVSDEMPEPTPDIWAQILADYHLILLKMDEFTNQITSDFEQFKTDVNESQTTFETSMEEQWEAFKQEIIEKSGIDDSVTATDKTWSSDKINTELGKKANSADVKSTVKTITIQPEAWVEGVYTLSDSLITVTSNQEFLPPIYTAEKAEMIEAIQAANIQDGGQSAGQAKIVCTGEVPTIAIELRVIFRGVK